MVDLFDNERDKIYEAVLTVQRKFIGKEASGDNLHRLQNELVDRLEDLGFGATVDVSPILRGEFATVSIDSRLDNKPFDAEKKRWEVKHRDKDDHKKTDQIEGLT